MFVGQWTSFSRIVHLSSTEIIPLYGGRDMCFARDTDKPRCISVAAKGFKCCVAVSAVSEVVFFVRR